MGPRTRVLVVDDSAVVRKLVTMALEPEDDLEIVGAARDGATALELIESAEPDLVTLDVEMPGMDGLATLEEIHRRRPGLAVIMFASVTESSAETTINALRAGALDYVTKPVARSSDEAIDLIRNQLLPKIRVLAPSGRRLTSTGPLAAPAETVGLPDASRVSVEMTLTDPARVSGRALPARRPSSRSSGPIDRRITARRLERSPRPERTTGRRPAAPSTAPMPGGVGDRAGALPDLRSMPARRIRHGGRIDVIAIGVSTGGPVALDHILGALPAAFPVPVVIVQHMPELFTDILAQRLDTKCALTVRQAVHRAPLERGDVWVAPGGKHLEVVAGERGPELKVTDGPAENSCKPSADVLFRSVAATYGSRVLALVLTGMGMDGTHGAAAIAESGGTVIAQDEASSVVWGMPSSVIDHGIANQVVALDQIAPLLVRRVGRR